ncbi:MAG: hypothetical protein K0S23_2803 [Fluviicola sp.]|jgi:hypothetical protein|nr:hypothetical protein [Fluviicola sp.]
MSNLRILYSQLVRNPFSKKKTGTLLELLFYYLFENLI